MNISYNKSGFGAEMRIEAYNEVGESIGTCRFLGGVLEGDHCPVVAALISAQPYYRFTSVFPPKDPRIEFEPVDNSDIGLVINGCLVSQCRIEEEYVVKYFSKAAAVLLGLNYTGIDGAEAYLANPGIKAVYDKLQNK